MNRRNFVSLAALASLGLAAPERVLQAAPRKKPPVTNFSLTHNTIRYFGEAFHTPTRIVFLSDTHLWQSDEREDPYRQYSGRMAAAYNQTQHFQTGQPTNPMQAFEETLKLAVQQKADLLILAGDIFSYPSEAALDWAQAKLKEAGIPYLYIAGNHDWHYEGMPGSLSQLRETWSAKRLMPLYQGANPLMSYRDVNGIRFIALDNSTYEIQPEQVAFYKKHVQFDGPVVLVAHIPFYVPGRPIVFGCGHPQWGVVEDKGYELERRPQWPRQGHTKVTLDFHERVFSTPNLVGLLTGHIHTQSLDVYRGIPQFVAPPNLAGGFLDVRFEPV
ncbi:metallophosphoesterase [Pseudomonas sp. RC10]|uniref:metallophosphoesterase family protein n=1 Tax=Pseudomonas bambusae TaxID=3139142 RepID=UPI00313A1AF9